MNKVEITMDKKTALVVAFVAFTLSVTALAAYAPAVAMHLIDAMTPWARFAVTGGAS